VNKEIQQAVERLESALRQHSSDTAVSFNVFINNQETVWSFENRSPEQLRYSNMSMKNLAGKFIK